MKGAIFENETYLKMANFLVQIFVRIIPLKNRDFKNKRPESKRERNFEVRIRDKKNRHEETR
jgi:hypothetical protein